MLIRAPKNSANDEAVKVVAILANAGQMVVPGQTVMEVETAKAVIEVVSPAAGVFHPVASLGDTVSVGGTLAVVGPEGTDFSKHLAAAESAPLPSDAPAQVAGSRLSRAAADLIARHNLDPSLFHGQGLVTAGSVEAYLERIAAASVRRGSPVRRGGNGRIVLVGAGPGAWQLLSALESDPDSEVVGILDDDPAKQGRELNGVKIIGPVAMLFDLAREGRADSAICTTPTSIPFRARVHQMTREAGLRGANVIHPTAVFDAGVTIGEGNFIGALCFFGAETQLGDYCFISSRTTFEHHNKIGDGITTGPTVSTAGLVTLGNHIRFGGHVLVEPNVTIGDGAIIASGAIVTADVAAAAIIRQRVAPR
jgi:sugar O-acyltransferase (sialic acid O-acetyltransferase NeuD family)